MRSERGRIAELTSRLYVINTTLATGVMCLPLVHKHSRKVNTVSSYRGRLFIFLQENRHQYSIDNTLSGFILWNSHQGHQLAAATSLWTQLYKNCMNPDDLPTNYMQYSKFQLLDHYLERHK